MEHIGRKINYVSHKIKHAIHSLDKQKELSPTHQRILGYLYHHDDKVYQSDLESLFNIRRSSVSELIASLEQKQLVYRLVDEHDSRKKQLLLTKQGEEYAKQCTAFINAFEQRLANTLGENLDVLSSCLDLLIEELDKIQEEGLDD